MATSCLDPTTIRSYVAGTWHDVAPIVAHVETCELCRRRVALAVRAARPPTSVTSVEQWLASRRSVRPLRGLRKRGRR